MRDGDSLQLFTHELTQVEAVVGGDALMNDPQLVLTQTASGRPTTLQHASSLRTRAETARGAGAFHRPLASVRASAR